MTGADTPSEILASGLLRKAKKALATDGYRQQIGCFLLLIAFHHRQHSGIL
jgi:hypothetical protein